MSLSKLLAGEVVADPEIVQAIADLASKFDQFAAAVAADIEAVKTQPTGVLAVPYSEVLAAAALAIAEYLTAQGISGPVTIDLSL